mmetsp:Transcript_29224/g.62145  ORF Transcript_29224/g.62145 Transcript_29224/m.62145 type:complete len:256 (-) Transcript_29224:118-885(-)|eukprot:CAMPEP_0172312612 /NCGR_PEP_ID=MMETSP1058-20130122/18140_1 /TAXON_ID=83371 /ORGANISM="Detonula confervacea, Strain CCMP 353" /LENGTH=255 /DNA_ID=CAMNT_0013026129 /DNA_START=136 /DNA_END=903 /DNA_ORIENTATION=-
MKSFLLGGCALASLLIQYVSAFAPTTHQSPPSSFTRTKHSINKIQLNARPQTRFRQVQANILTRRTINEFAPELPSDWERSLEHAIEAAIYAPNHKRSEPWRFHLLGPKSIENVCKLNADIVASKKGEVAGEKKLKRWLQMPGWLVVTCVKSANKGGGEVDTDADTMADPMGLAREDYAACCCAVQNLCLSLSAQGIGTKWTTGPVNFDERFAEAVGFSHENEYTVGTIWFGTPVSSPSPPGKKIGLDHVLRRVE